MEMELLLADIFHEHKINTVAAKTKMRKIRRYALDKERCLQYSFGAIVILVAVFIAMLGLVRCAR